MDGPVFSGLKHFSGSVAGPVLGVLSWFSIVSGVWLAISALLLVARPGRREGLVRDVLMRLFISAVLLSLDAAMESLGSGIFGNTVVRTPALSWNSGDRVLDRALPAAFACFFRFVYVVGWMAFVNGWFCLRSAFTGRGTATFSGASMRILGGVACVHLADVLELIQDALGVHIFR